MSLSALSIPVAAQARFRSPRVVASQFDLDGLLLEIPEINQSKSGRQRVIDRAKRDSLMVRQLAQITGGYGGLSFTGTPGTIANQIKEWLSATPETVLRSCFPIYPTV